MKKQHPIFNKVKLLTVISLSLLTLTACGHTRQEAPGNKQAEASQSQHIVQKHKPHKVHQAKKAKKSVSKPKTKPKFKKRIVKRNYSAKKLAATETSSQAKFAKTWSYTPAPKFKMMPLDYLGRAKGSHIQIYLRQMPTAKRSPRLTIRPSGWHNYKFTTIHNGKRRTVWLFNRGHLVGYQFCGLNQAPGNMITQTAYVNQGGLGYMNQYNKNGQLFYEMKLRKWLYSHPNSKLDYSVIPLYKGSDLVPSQIAFYFVGLKSNGKKVRINAGGRSYHQGKMSYVLLNNISPQAKINYATGRAMVFPQ